MTDYYSPTPGADYLRKVNYDHKYRHENMSVDMDVWYPFLESITFKTYFIHITRKEAESILNFFDYKYKNKDDIFTAENTKILLNLEKKIDYYFNTYEDLKNGAMFRLSGRSGKDMHYYDNEKIYKSFLKNWEENCKKYNTDKTDINTKYISITKLMDKFKVTCGKDVLNTLLTSYRLHSDLNDWLKHGGREQIVLRKWENNSCEDREFRCFVRDNELKAICQDERFALFPELIKNKDLYEKLINEFFNTKLKPLMKIPHYIVDVCILQNNEVKLIEFSPFLTCTSARLFRWKVNHEEMLHGKGKLTVREKEYENLNMFIKDWENCLLKPSEHYDDYFIKETTGNKINNFFSYINPKNIFNNKYPKKKIFVVSVLKQGFYWSKKYITYEDQNTNKNLGKGILENHCISIDKNGFGWIVEKKGKKCFGEIIEVSYEDFLDIEFFYAQLDSKMQEINVKLNNNNNVRVYVYVIKGMFKNVKREKDYEVEEYNLDIEKKEFNPMQHIINQQERYLNMSLDFDINDSW